MSVITKPINPTGPVSFLAMANISPDDLKSGCVKRAEVKSIDDRQHVTIKVEGITYTNVPVYIHTDIGTRMAAIRELDNADPSICFKDAALMFPIAGYEVLALINGSKGVCVFHIVKDPIADLPIEGKCSPTYKFYARFAIGANGVGTAEFYLWDMIENKIATIPTITTIGGEMGLPFFAVNKVLDGTSELQYYMNYYALGYNIGMQPLIDKENIGDALWSRVTGGHDYCYMPDDDSDPDANEQEITPAYTISTEGSGDTPGEADGYPYHYTSIIERTGNCYDAYYYEYHYSDVDKDGLYYAPDSPHVERWETYDRNDMILYYDGGYGISLVGDPLISVTYNFDGGTVVKTKIGGLMEFEASADRPVVGSNYGEYTYNGEKTAKLIFKAEITRPNEPKLEYSWEIETFQTANIYTTDGGSEWYRQGEWDEEYDFYRLIRLGKIWRIDDNNFVDLLSVSFVMFGDYETYRYHDGVLVPVENQITGTSGYNNLFDMETEKVLMGPSYDILIKPSPVAGGTTGLSNYAYSRLNDFIDANPDIEPLDFIDDYDNILGAVFDGFFFMPYSIAEEMLREGI